MKIEQIESLIEPHLKSGRKVVSHLTEKLVATGENYGSIILAVDVTLNDGEVLHLVAKLIPPNEIIKKIFNISVAFKKESDFYKTLIPSLNTFNEESQVEILDHFPKYYGSRLSLPSSSSKSPNVNFDENACLLLENANYQDFHTLDRLQGFDLKVTEYLVRALALFHATPIAFKLKRPGRFEKIKSLLKKNLTDREVSSMHAKNTCKSLYGLISEDVELGEYLEAMKPMVEKQVESYLTMDYESKEPFNTFIHNDLWLNNILLKFAKGGDEGGDEGYPVAHRFVDFQMAVYGNPANDLLFLLHSSVRPECIFAHFDRLVDIYYEALLDKLREFRVDVAPFRREIFDEEMKQSAQCSQLYHSLFMLYAIFNDKNRALSGNDLVSIDMSTLITPQFKPQLRALILNFVKHNWI